MKLNNKGFAITTILYGTLILFILLFISLLGILSQYKKNLERLIESNNGARDIVTMTPQNISSGEIICNTDNENKAKKANKNDGYYFECISLLYKIFAELQKKNYIPQNQYNLIKPAIEYIEENFLRRKISVPYLADKCGISEVYLKKLFIKKFGIPPTKYTIQLKINHACDLLRSECNSITQVANLCGYKDVYYFSRQLKNYVGVTPSAFEQRYKSSK